MQTNKLAIYLLITASLLAVLHNMALQYGWYLQYFYTDIVMHLLGGIVLAFFISLFVLAKVSVSAASIKSLAVVLVLTFIIAVGWEVFETFFEITRDPGVGTDTITDVLHGIVGAVLGWKLSRAGD